MALLMKLVVTHFESDESVAWTLDVIAPTGTSALEIESGYSSSLPTLLDSMQLREAFAKCGVHMDVASL